MLAECRLEGRIGCKAVGNHATAPCSSRALLAGCDHSHTLISRITAANNSSTSQCVRTVAGVEGRVGERGAAAAEVRLSSVCMLSSMNSFLVWGRGCRMLQKKAARLCRGTRRTAWCVVLGW